MSNIVYTQVTHTKDAHALVEQYHYSGRAVRTASLCCAAISGDTGEYLAACFFSVPPSRWSRPVYELCRLVRHPEAADVTLTKLVSVSVKAARREGKRSLLVSFADRTQEHHGGIYQAASWRFGGMRPPRVDGFTIDGKLMPMRTCNGAFGTSSVTKIAALVEARGGTCEPHWDRGKMLFWKAVDKRGAADAAALGLKDLPYLKPDLLC